MNDAFGQRFGFAPRNAARGTDRVAGRGLTVIQAINTQIALDRGFPVIIILHGPEGTGCQTFLTPDAQIFIYQNQAHVIS